METVTIESEISIVSIYTIALKFKSSLTKVDKTAAQFGYNHIGYIVLSTESTQ